MRDEIDKKALRDEVARVARELIEADQIERGAEVLADYRKRFEHSPDDYLRRGILQMFIFDLVRASVI